MFWTKQVQMEQNVVLIYGSETMLWKEERFGIRAVHMDNLRGLLGIRRMDRVPNAGIREL